MQEEENSFIGLQPRRFFCSPLLYMSANFYFCFMCLQFLHVLQRKIGRDTNK